MNYGEKRDFRRQRYDDKCEKSNYQSGPGKRDGWSNNYDKTHQIKEPSNSKNSEKSLSTQSNSQEHHIEWMEPDNPERRSDNSKNRQTHRLMKLILHS